VSIPGVGGSGSRDAYRRHDDDEYGGDRYDQSRRKRGGVFAH
jgi:hypothetical protein